MSIPEELQNAVVRLTAPNDGAADGETDVYMLGMSHVSQESVKAVRSLIKAVRPEVAFCITSRFQAAQLVYIQTENIEL